MYDVTTVEQKAALVTAGWKPKDAGTYEAWEKGDFTVALYGDDVRNIGHKRQKDVPLAVAIELAAILSIAPAGHVLVPTKVADAALLFLKATVERSTEEGNLATDTLTSKVKHMGAGALQGLLDALTPKKAWLPP